MTTFKLECIEPNEYRIVNTQKNPYVPPLMFSTDDCCKELADFQLEAAKGIVKTLNSNDKSPEFCVNAAVELLCSATEIARRKGEDTNWDGFLKSTLEVLAEFNRNGITARTYKSISPPIDGE